MKKIVFLLIAAVIGLAPSVEAQGFKTIVASGTITTQNLVPAGVPTAASAVTVSVSANTALRIQTVGTYTGALSLQGTVDGSTWVTVGGTPLTPDASGTAAATIVSAAQGTYKANVSGFSRVRITALAAVTGSVVVTLRTTPGL